MLGKGVPSNQEIVAIKAKVMRKHSMNLPRHENRKERQQNYENRRERRSLCLRSKCCKHFNEAEAEIQACCFISFI